MRLFVALPISSDLEHYSSQIQYSIRSISKNVRLVDPKNIHLTLKFLGEVAEDKVGIIIEKLRTITHEAFELQITHLGFFPNNESAKVLWMGISAGSSINKLQQRIDSILNSEFPDDFTFHAHLTLGRIPLPLPKTEIEKIAQIRVEHKTLRVNEFRLMKSVLAQEGPIYSIVETFSLS